MTGRELIKWILDNHAEYCMIEVQYRDKDRVYEGTDKDPLLITTPPGQDEYGWYNRVIL